MKLEHHKSLSSEKHTWILEIDESELVTYIPGQMEKETKKVFEATNKVSDALMYLSEVAKSIEDNQLPTQEGGKNEHQIS